MLFKLSHFVTAALAASSAVAGGFSAGGFTCNYSPIERSCYACKPEGGCPSLVDPVLSVVNGLYSVDAAAGSLLNVIPQPWTIGGDIAGTLAGLVNAVDSVLVGAVQLVELAVCDVVAIVEALLVAVERILSALFRLSVIDLLGSIVTGVEQLISTLLCLIVALNLPCALLGAVNGVVNTVFGLADDILHVFGVPGLPGLPGFCVGSYKQC